MGTIRSVLTRPHVSCDKCILPTNRQHEPAVERAFYVQEMIISKKPASQPSKKPSGMPMKKGGGKKC